MGTAREDHCLPSSHCGRCLLLDFVAVAAGCISNLFQSDAFFSSILCFPPSIPTGNRQLFGEIPRIKPPHSFLLGYFEKTLVFTPVLQPTMHIWASAHCWFCWLMVWHINCPADCHRTEHSVGWQLSHAPWFAPFLSSQYMVSLIR